MWNVAVLLLMLTVCGRSAQMLARCTVRGKASSLHELEPETLRETSPLSYFRSMDWLSAGNHEVGPVNRPNPL